MVTPSMLLFDFWLAFNVVLFLDMRFTGWQQRKYYRETKCFKRSECPRIAFMINGDKRSALTCWIYICFIAPAFIASIIYAALLALCTAIFDHFNDEFEYFLNWW